MEILLIGGGIALFLLLVAAASGRGQGSRSHGGNYYVGGHDNNVTIEQHHTHTTYIARNPMPLFSISFGEGQPKIPVQAASMDSIEEHMSEIKQVAKRRGLRPGRSYTIETMNEGEMKRGDEPLMLTDDEPSSHKNKRRGRR